MYGGIMRHIYLCLGLILLSGCSMFGKSSVEIAPYKVITSNSEQHIEIRHYDSLVLVSTPMGSDLDEGRNAAFAKLFDYISGNNTDSSKIAMTAPVLMNGKDETGVKIAMTAPVFMDDKTTKKSRMSFVLPASFSIQTAPIPNDDTVKLEELKDYKVAVITFNGRLNEDNIQKHKTILEQWITTEGIEITGPYKAAGYNPPLTIPELRRNEVLIPVK